MMLWILSVCLGIALCAFKLLLIGMEKKRLLQSGIREIDKMDGIEFEKYLEALFVKLGYEVERTRAIGDFGADLLLQKDGIRTAVQAKRYHKSVGVKAIQEVVAAQGYYRCKAAMVVTNSTFTQQATELARHNSVILWDREALIHRLLSSGPVSEASPAQTPALSSITSNPDCCIVCGAAVSEKIAQYCRSYPERFGGVIYCFAHQKASRRSA